MSKSLVAQFQTLISPFGDEEVSKCIAALHKSGVVENLDECPQKLFEIVKNAMEYGNISGCICVQSKGAIDSLPTREIIEAYIRENK